MIRRSILQLSSRCQPIRRFPRPIKSERIPPLSHFARNGFSTAPPGKSAPKAGEHSKTAESGSSSGKVVLGSAILVAAGFFAYQAGYLDKYFGEEKKAPADIDSVDVHHQEVMEIQPAGIIATIEPPKFGHEEPQVAKAVESTLNDVPHIEAEGKAETHVELPRDNTGQRDETPADIIRNAEKTLIPELEVAQHEAESNKTGEDQSAVELKFDPLTGHVDGSAASQSTDSQLRTDEEPKQEVQVTQTVAVSEETILKTAPPQHVIEERAKITAGKDKEESSLFDAYFIKQSTEENTARIPEEQALVNAIEELNDGYATEDGKLLMDFLQVIHAAEKRQAQLDALAFAEEKKALKEKYEKELRDSRARELMLAEEAAMLDKEIKRERAKAAGAMRSLQEKMEEKLRVEIEQKESEAESNLNKVQELAKAELASAIASEKAAQIEKMAEANLSINALCMAFYARSEETRQIHSVHKLTLGALALEDAHTKGLPIQQELDCLSSYFEEIEKDSLLHLVLSTLPEDTRHHGTNTLPQLNQKFNSLKGSLRHHILMPTGGGGIMAHALAQMASWLRIKDADPSGEGIESIISRVEKLLVEGKLAEAADALQECARGSQAEEVVGDWLRQARSRAIAEQALTVLQSYATSISLTQ